MICSTGNGSLDLADLQALRPGTMVASVTSADDEFASLAQLPWPSEEVCPHVLALNRPDGSQIYLLNRGEAVNFVHGAVIGEYVYLVLAEIVEGIRMLAAGPLLPACSSCQNRRCVPLPAIGWPIFMVLTSTDLTKPGSAIGRRYATFRHWPLFLWSPS